MIVIVLIVLGLCLGSFANATIWRLHERSKKSKKLNPELSIVHGRSMCPHCRHQLAGKDLVPLVSWLSLGGKCRYCKKPISRQYPLIELVTALLFVVSYCFWPYLQGDSPVIAGLALFGIWLACLTCLVILAVYDAKWMLLPNKVVFILIGLAAVSVLLRASIIGFSASYFADVALGLVFTAGLFGALYFVSGGKWIGFGDVKLSIALGLLMASAPQALLLLFIASLLGSLFSLPGLVSGRLKRTAQIPFGPFLIAATFIVYLFGQSITNWLQVQLLLS